MKQIEIMSPAGNFESLQAAIQAKADSVYFGVQQLNMRAHGANNFTLKDLPKIIKLCEKHRIKTYLTVNSILYNEDLELMKKIIDKAKAAGISAIIACDIAAIQYANSIGQEVHTSTQLNVSNIEAVKFFAQFTDVIVLARELTLKQIKEICDEIKKQKIKGSKGELIKIEIFCHGALCVSISGKCYMSLAKYNWSANRGKCFQPCRRAYRVIDEETGDELKIDNKYVMSPKDLCTIKFLDKIIESGVSVLKIEGRARPPEYVYTVTKVYKEAALAVKNKTFNDKKIKAWIKELETVYNRGFWHGGYYLGKKLGEWAGVRGSKATIKKTLLGKVEHYFDKKHVAHLNIQNQEIKTGNELLITGPTTGIVKTKIKGLYKDGKPTKGKAKGADITIPLEKKVRKNDKVFLLKKL
ncbi:MAG: U32 family peptidase [Nanoarchaeota archaeon]|nr:U32 family peptidase [Nanoarchaeota archaeon]MBU1051335.1 U32 family peptidase [Nanoarchaeota archaeon]